VATHREPRVLAQGPTKTRDLVFPSVQSWGSSVARVTVTFVRWQAHAIEASWPRPRVSMRGHFPLRLEA